jgi:DNA-binding FrmR family transcriptional regulator
MPAGETPMSADVIAASPAVVNRLKRAQGQLSGILRMLEEGRDIEEVVHQLKAVSSAIDRAGFAILVVKLKEAMEDSGEDADEHVARLEKLFLRMC